MAQITVTIPNNQVSRVISAFDAKFGRQAGETDTALAQRILADFTRRTVREYESEQATRTAAQNVTDIDAT